MSVPLFRAPYGVRCPQLEKILNDRRMHHIHWDIDAQEWRHGNVKRTVAFITRNIARERSRAVVLLHDTKIATVKSLPEILDWIDRENVTRSSDGRRLIRVLDATSYVAESTKPWLAELEKLAGALTAKMRRHLASVVP
jgi:hypothetical protein